jgi:regulator of extracellular matrix RemA (YlzA/DUF370 family)
MFVNVGEDSIVNTDKVLAILPYNTKKNPQRIKRMIRTAKETNTLLDLCGTQFPARGLIVTDAGVLIKIPLRPRDVKRNIDTLDITRNESLY